MPNVPALFWDLTVSGNIQIEYNDNGGGWLTALATTAASTTPTLMIQGLPSVSIPTYLYNLINTEVNGILGGGTVDYEITEIDSGDDAVGGLRARRFKLVDNNASGVEVRVTAAALLPLMGTTSPMTTSSGEFTFESFYDGCFMLPDRMAHDWRNYQKAVIGSTISQSRVVSVRRRAKTPERNFKWIAVPAGFVRMEASYDSNFRTEAGLASATDTDNTFEHFWDQVILEGKDFYFMEMDPDDWSTSNTVYDYMVVADPNHISDFEDMLRSRLGDMAKDYFDVQFRATIKSSSYVDI